MSDNTYANNTRQTTNSYASNNLGPYSSLLQDQVYNKNSQTGGKNPYSEPQNSVYAKKQNWEEPKVYQQKEMVQKSQGYRRFHDLKILNEQIINLSNNMQPEESPLEVLSQGQKGEIKNLLWARIWKISLLPALGALLLTLTVILTDYLLVTLLMLTIYVYLVGRTFFYPAKLYYENIQFKTTKHARLFYEEMDFWFKLGVVKILMYFALVIIFTFVMIFFEDTVVANLLKISQYTDNTVKQGFLNYISTVSFSYSLLFLVLIYIGTIFLYFKFINQEKTKNDELLKIKMKHIRNQTMSRVEQIQADKNEIQ